MKVFNKLLSLENPARVPAFGRKNMLGVSVLVLSLFFSWIPKIEGQGILCKNYDAGSADASFCRETACAGYCRSLAKPYYCMQENYVKPGYCTQTGGFPAYYCQTVTGIEPQNENWCQTTACNYAYVQCRNDPNVDQSTCRDQVAQYVETYFPTQCVRNSNTPTSGPPVTSTKGPSPTTTKRRCKPRSTTRSVTTPQPTAPETTTPYVPPPPTTGGGTGNDCWAATDWQNGPCKLCPVAATWNQCSAFSSQTCYPTEDACKTANGGGGDNGGGGGSCGGDCKASTRDGIKRPNFKGPSCYTSEYGSQFGPDWAPSGKTGFEKIVSSPTVLFKMTQTTPDAYPILSSWGISGCDAATAVYENLVCALELLEATGKSFEAPSGGTPASISDFANSGDAETDRREIAGFFAHQWKETGRLGTWEENTATPYADDTDPTYPAVPGKTYHGRGPIQISYNFNYGALSEWFFNDKMVLLNDPDVVDPEGPMGYISAFWFWFTPRQFTSNSPISGNLRTRDAIVHWTDGKLNSLYTDGVNYDAYAGLGLATNVVNGGVECTGSGESAGVRVNYFMTIAARLDLKLPDLSTGNCSGDKFCEGLFSGCSSTKVMTCNPQEQACGTTYVVGWQQYLCK